MSLLSFAIGCKGCWDRVAELCRHPIAVRLTIAESIAEGGDAVADRPQSGQRPVVVDCRPPEVIQN